MKKLIVLLTVVTCSGCTQFMGSSLFDDADTGHFALIADAEGLRAYNDGVLGLVTTQTEQRDHYWTQRESQVKARSLRYIPQPKVK